MSIALPLQTLGIFTNLNVTELAVIAAGAVMVFGKDLPRVVVRGMQQLAKLRRAVTEMWKEAGLEQELRRVRVELDSEVGDLSAAKQALVDGKKLLNGPVSQWRQNIGKQVEEAIALDSIESGDVGGGPGESAESEPEPEAGGAGVTGELGEADGLSGPGKPDDRPDDRPDDGEGTTPPA